MASHHMHATTSLEEGRIRVVRPYLRPAIVRQRPIGPCEKPQTARWPGLPGVGAR
jgi:hypothetical protein